MDDENNRSGGMQSLRQWRDKLSQGLEGPIHQQWERFTGPNVGGNSRRRYLWPMITGVLVVLLLFSIFRQQNLPTPLKPAAVVCSSDSNHNWSGWHLTGGWKQLNGMLLNDGTNGGYNGRSTLVAPASCQPKTADYAVEATIQVVSFSDQFSGFGINVRSGPASTDPAGYSTYIDSTNGANISVVGGDSLNSASFNPARNSHVYRAEVKGNTVNFLIDGATVLSVVDNRFISTGKVGLWCANAQIEVSSFQVFKL
ncbi:MAG TPA: hypothetical protein VF043_31380 [Ktedonobacteraceae bacterium]